MVEIAGFVVADEALVARGVMQLWELKGMRLDSILQLRRSTIVAHENPIPICCVVENAGSSHGIHHYSCVLVAGRDKHVDIGNVVAN